MKRTLTTITALLFALAAFAQSADDACLFSQTYYQGTAKALGMGNAMGAVGGDMTAASINPAGLGIYRSSEVTTTFSLMDNYNASTYYGTQDGANKFRFSIPNVGFVGTKEKSNFRPLRFVQFGIWLTRTNDFNQHTLSRGINPTSSKIDSYLARMDGYTPNELQDAFPYDIYPAWNTYLIDLYQDEEGPYYGSPVPQGNIWQAQENEFKGRNEAWTFAGGFNYFDKLYLGLSLDLTHIKRVGTKTFTETPVSGTETDFNEWHYKEDLSSRAIGVNAKVGLIYHANNWLRLGAAFHSPTIYSFDEKWQTETESQIVMVTRKSLSPESSYEYIFISPLKWVGSLAFILDQRGMISLDAEYTNYGAARFRTAADDDFDYTPTNDLIKETYGRTFNFRLGSEWRVSDSYLRVGVGYYGSPFGLGETGGSVKKASCGLSVPVSKSISFDFAYELTYGKSYQILYDAGDLGIEPVTQKQFKNLVATTFKIRF